MSKLKTQRNKKSASEEPFSKAPLVSNIIAAAKNLKSVVRETPLDKNNYLSEKYQAEIYLKREDLQHIRSFKIRGAYHKISSLSKSEKSLGVVCASAGNHSQGVALSCALLKIHGVIFMPQTTPSQKVNRTKKFGKNFVDIRLTGKTFDDAYHEAQRYAQEHQATLVPPFDDMKVIEGQATVGLEILAAAQTPIDYLLIPVGGGGLAAGISSYFKARSPNTTLIGVEPAGAASMQTSIKQGENKALTTIDSFIDGAAVKKVGERNFHICRKNLNRMLIVPEGKACSTLLTLYNEEAIIAEPAGALSIAALDDIKDEIRGKTVVCILSGGNNDISRTQEIEQRALLHEGLKQFFIINLAQHAGALRKFMLDVIGPNDDIVHFEYQKKHNRAKGPAIIGIELKNQHDLSALLQRMSDTGIAFEHLNEQQMLLQRLI